MSSNTSVQLSDAPPDDEGTPLLRDDAPDASGATNGLFSSASNLTQNTLGAGVFGIPMAIASTGLGGGIAALVLVCVISAFTLNVLGQLVKRCVLRFAPLSPPLSSPLCFANKHPLSSPRAGPEQRRIRER